MKSTPLHVLTFALVASFLVIAGGCGNISVSISDGDDAIEGSGGLTTKTFEVDEFDSIDVESSFDVTVTVGDTEFVEVTTNDNLVDELDISVRNGELTIGLQDDVSVRNGTLNATIRVPQLVEVEASGASSVAVDGAFGPDQRYSASGASEVIVVGSAITVQVEASGASDLDLQLSDVTDVELDLSGASSLTLQAADQASGEMSGASDLTLPQATIANIDLSGASTISRN